MQHSPREMLHLVFERAKSNIALAPLRRLGGSRLLSPALFFASLLLTAQGPVHSAEIKLQENAPDRHIVEKGDTLWSIAGKFLKDPWRWAEIWRMNQDQLKNPNRIFPGNVIVLDRGVSPARLVLGETVKLTPQVRREPLANDAIPAIPPNIIEPFLGRPLVIEAGGLDNAPRIVATQESRVNIGAGGIAYVVGVGSDPKTIWQIYRPGRALVDPDTKAVLGNEAVFLGTGRVTRDGTPATLEIVTALQEISSGDRLIAAGPVRINQYVPRAPTVSLKGRIIGIYNGLTTSESGRDSVVSISRGKRDGVEEGHVFAMVRASSVVADPEVPVSRDSAPSFSLPAERYGLLFVFRVFDAVSYALVMESSRTVSPRDFVQTP